jgi:radical SAM superfamily enzyme YgiQ (UPF0313 family)
MDKRKRILLTSVFGPYALDDEFGSRLINPMSLYDNQVTRAQGPFSLHMFHGSWGLQMIQENINEPCTLLDFPSLETFRRELTRHRYDVVGISSIIVNVGKVKEMCRIIRELSPHSRIIVGGHVAALPELDQLIDADHIVRGEGIRWMREFLGEDVNAPIRHPHIISALGMHMMGIKVPDSPGSSAAVVIPSVGCPMGCNFCTTSSFFGGKGHFVDFYSTGAELFQVMEGMEREMKAWSFFIMDENFLLHKNRAMELLGLMRGHGKSWSLNVFSSANAIKKYTMAELVELGISWLWMGLESRASRYEKLKGSDTTTLVSELQDNGIKILGSTIIGLEHHTPENMEDEIDYALEHNTDFHQFMLYTPVPGTPLYDDLFCDNLILPDVDLADIHGQFQLTFKHAAISPDQSKTFLDEAFIRDYRENGPSLFRISQTILKGWQKYKNSPDTRVRERFRKEASKLKAYAVALWAMERFLREENPPIAERVHGLRLQIENEFGWSTKCATRLFGWAMLWATRREDRALKAGKVYEPPTVIHRRNWVPVYD